MEQPVFLNQKQTIMSWKKNNRDYINDSISLTSSVIVIAISLLILCLADNI